MLQRLLKLLGLDLRRYETRDSVAYKGVDYFHDIEILLRNSVITVVDVGANNGDWAASLSRYLNKIDYYFGFEPDERVFPELRVKLNKLYNINHFKVFNFALGAENKAGILKLMNSTSMNSLMALGKDGWGYEVGQQQTVIEKIDNFFAGKNLIPHEFISLLKIDTQGYDFEVLKGAKELLSNQNVNIVLVEIILSKIYKNEDYFVDLLTFMSKMNYYIYGFYDQHSTTSSLDWFDVMFISKRFKEQLN